MHTIPSGLSDAQIVEEIRRNVTHEFCSLAELLSLLAEMDDRRLYAQLGYSSLFAYMTEALHLSEDATWKRTQAARAAKRFPLILTLLAEGKLTLTTINLLTPILTDANHEEWLTKAVFQSKREVERMVATYAPRSDVPDMIRALPMSTCAGAGNEVSEARDSEPSPIPERPREEIRHQYATPLTPARRDAIAPLSEQRVKIQFTGSETLRGKIERAKEILRHKHPQGKLEDIFEEALDTLLEKCDPERKIARKEKNRASRQRPQTTSCAHSRYIPQSVKDIVWQRDEGRCQFVSADGKRCDERGFLQFDHVKPFALGGSSTDPENLMLKCHTHNQLAMREVFGVRTPPFPAHRSSS